MRCGYGQSLKPNASAPSFLAWYHSVTAIRASDVHCLFRESLPARPPHSGFARFSHKSCVLLLAQRGEYADCGYFRFAPIVRDTAAAGWLRPSLAEGRGLSLITVCGYRRETRVLFLLRAFWWWVKSFFSVGLGGARFRAPLDLPVLIPRVKNGLPAGSARRSARDKPFKCQ